MSKALVVLSGGMDSATALALMLKSYGNANVCALTFQYGSKHNLRELQAAEALACHYGIEKHEVIHLPFVGELFKSDLLKSGGLIPDGHYADLSMMRTVVPFRNGIMLSIAAGYAESHGARLVVIGNHAGDHAIYPDCRGKFIKNMSKAIKAGTYAEVELHSPFCDLNKEDIVSVGTELEVPYVLTYSCYKGKENHCGTCGTCVERQEAFNKAHVPDPTTYKAESSS